MSGSAVNGAVNRLVNRVACMLAEASVIPYKAMRYDRVHLSEYSAVFKRINFG